MNKMTAHEEKLLELVLADMKAMVADTMLATLGDQEYRICLLELGINL